jgi:HAE1 family hydrophobic/amphiphilic exporter-1
MYYLDVTLNTISITGLVLALGLLVDSSIVVTENILRKYKEGMSLMEASLAGTNEVKGALLGSTLTTLAVFIPILNVDGMIGMIARDLALTICIAVTISYITSVILIPVFASRLLNEKEYQRNTPFMRFIVWMEGLYAKSLVWAINHKFVVLGLVFAVFYATVQIYNVVPFQSFPQSEPNGFRVNVELPAGTKLVTTAEVLRDFSSTLMADSSFSTVVTEIGSNGQNQESNTGSIEVTVLPKGERMQTPDELMMKYRQRLQFPGANININPRGGGGLPGFGGRGWGGGWGGGGNNVRVTLIGSDVMYMQGIADKLESILTLDTLITSVEISRTSMVPELHYILDRQMLAMAGGNINQVANAIKSQARGTQVGQYRVDGREIPIEVRMLEEFRSNRMDLARLEVLEVNDQRIPVSSIGQFESYEGLSRIQRRDRETVMDINIGVIGNPVELESKVRQLIEDQVVLPEGYRYQFAGDGQDARDASSSLFLALGVALLLIYMVMAGMFENLRDPFVVMFTVPLAFFGSVFFLWIIGTPLSILSSLGIIILIGIVVNNGIVLIDFIKQYTTNEDNPEEYMSEFIRACVRRMRPIIMTMFTTIMSMLPLALELGVGSEQWSPLAKSIIGGLSFSALFTLFVIPVFYLGISKSKRAIVRAAYVK